ncbi:S8 family serine peptidase [Streptomyces sp. NBC_00328]|uniref:S8 family serine peptidase n=1 Tax=Streptomyces sp. NBC_00328 TaxID=2903646 RepID=UPI002E2D1611|nr:S8 family serine peptidase [Streptomyces sp. NBC_00328]
MRSSTRCLLTALAAVAALAPTSTAPAAAAPSPSPSPAAGRDVTVLPPLPVRLGEGKPCTAPSERTATGGTWVAPALGLPRAQRLARGAGVTVAVVDSGVAPGTAGLSGRVTGAAEDCLGHGSFAASLIAAAPRTDSGVTGVAPGAAVLALPGTDARGVPSAALVAAGIRLAADRGADVIYTGAALPTGRAELTGAVSYATGKGALVVAPAAPDALPEQDGGVQDTPPPSGPYWPAAAPEALSVVDFGPSGTRPSGAPPAYRPDLAAPGDSMVGSGPGGKGHYIASGSSLAAADAAGAAALVRERHPDLSPAQVAARLLRTAYPADVPRLDPYAALSLGTGTGSDQGTAARAELPARTPEPADTGPRNTALAVFGVCLALVALLGVMALVVPRGRARRWTPPGVG